MAATGGSNPIATGSTAESIWCSSAEQTEWPSELPRGALRKPAGVCGGVMNEDGTMSVTVDLIALARRHGRKIGTIGDLSAYRHHNDRLVECVADEPFESDYGGYWRLKSYRNRVDGSVNLVLQKGPVDPEGVTLVRMHAVSIFDDIMGRPDRKSTRLNSSH